MLWRGRENVAGHRPLVVHCSSVDSWLGVHQPGQSDSWLGLDKKASFKIRFKRVRKLQSLLRALSMLHLEKSFNSIFLSFFPSWWVVLWHDVLSCSLSSSWVSESRRHSDLFCFTEGWFAVPHNATQQLEPSNSSAWAQTPQQNLKCRQMRASPQSAPHNALHFVVLDVDRSRAIDRRVKYGDTWFVHSAWRRTWRRSRKPLESPTQQPDGFFADNGRVSVFVKDYRFFFLSTHCSAMAQAAPTQYQRGVVKQVSEVVLDDLHL